MKANKKKWILGSAIGLIMSVLLVGTAFADYMTKGVWIIINGDILDEYWNEKFSAEEWQERAKASGDFYDGLYKIIYDTFHENNVSFHFCLYTARDSSYIETDPNDPDFLEKVLDEIEAEGEMNSVEWYVYMLYIKSTNEFVYRENLPEDSELHIDYDAVRDVITGDGEDMVKMENVCRVIAGEDLDDLQEESETKNVTAVAVAAVMVAAICVLAVVLYCSRKKKKSEN